MAPSSYEEVGLLEADGDNQSSCKKARPFGIVVATLAVLGLVGIASLSQNQYSAKQHLSVARKALLKAFSPRSLAEAAKLKSTIAFTLHQDEVPLDAKMSIKATVSEDKNPPDGQQLEVDISAEEGKGDDLKAALLDLAQKINEEVQHGQEPGRRLQEGDDMPFTVDVNENIVTFIIPMPQDGPPAEDMSKGLETKPTLSASLEFGRTLEEMCDHADDHVPMVFNGVKVQADASFAVTMFKAAGEMEQQIGGPPNMGDQIDMIEAFSKFSTNIELAYRSPDELGEELIRKFPPFHFFLEMLTHEVQHMGDAVQEAVKKLDGLSAGTKRMAIRGLPHDYQFVVELSGFNMAPVLKKLIERLG